MKWPLPQDFNEAVQNPSSAFADPDLKAGQPVVGPTGLPLPRSGNFADVYQIRTPDGRDWAVKCFTRPVTGLDHRYAKVEEALDKAGLPFTIGFTFLGQGVKVRGQWFPAVKMEWVDGLQLNQVVRDQAGNPKALDALCLMWSRLCKRLRDAGIAHADLQHGNVLLVPGSRPGSYGLKLIDYDGMYVPALANKPSGELGHANFQHPARAAKQIYSPDLDRFPHLVIATALKGLSVAGPSLWERYDNGDNLLFTEDDFRDPSQSKLMKELWLTGHPGVQSLVGNLAVACGKPIPQTPWLDQLAPDGIAVPLSAEQTRAAEAALGFAPAAQPAVAIAPAAVPVAADPLAFDTPPVAAAPSGGSRTARTSGTRSSGTRPSGTRLRETEPAKKSPLLPVALAAGILLLLGGGIAVAVLMSGKNKPAETVEAPPVEPPPKPAPQPAPPTPPDPPPGTPVPGVQSQPPLLWSAKVPAGHGRGPLAFDRAGTAVLIGSYKDGGVVGFDAATGQMLPAIQGHTFRNVYQFTPFEGGKAAAFNFPARAFCAWDPKTGKEAETIRLPAGVDIPGPAPVLSANGRFLSAWRNPPAVNGKIEPLPLKILDLTTGQPVVELPWTGGTVHFTADSSKALVVERGTKFRWFTLPHGEPTGEWDAPSPYTIHALSDDGNTLFCSRSEPESRVFLLVDGRTGKDIRPLTRGETHAVESAGHPASADARLFSFNAVTVPGSGAIVEVFRDTGERTARIKVSDFDRAFRWSSLSPDGRRLAVYLPDSGEVQVYDLGGGTVVAAPTPVSPAPSPPVPGGTIDLKPRLSLDLPPEITDPRVWFDHEGKNVVVAARPQFAAATFDAPGTPGKGIAPGQFPGGAYRLFHRPGGKVVFQNQGILTWIEFDPATGKADRLPQPPEVPPGNTLPFVEWSPDGRFLVAARTSPRVRGKTPRDATYPPAPFRLIDLSTSKELQSFNWTSGRVVFAPDSSRVLVVERTGRFRWFKLPTGEPDGEFTFPDLPGFAADAKAVSSDGQVILYHGRAPGAEVAFHLLDGKTGKILHSYPQQRYSTSAFAFMSADGKLIALPRTDGFGTGNVLELLDPAGKVLAALPLKDETGKTGAAALTRDGKQVAIAFGTRKLHLYNVERSPGPVAVKPMPEMPATGTSGKTRPAVPGAAAIADAEKNIREILKADYAKRQPAERKALAQKLLKLAGETADDPVARFVMLRDARDFAAEGQDPELALQAADETAKHYDVDAARLKIAALEKITATTVNNPTLLGIVELAHLNSDEAAALDDYESAMKYTQVAVTAARRGKLSAGGVLVNAEARVAQVRKAAEGFQKVKEALAKLETASDDADANLAVGRFRCFVQANWDEGLKYLAKGNDSALKALAEQDLAAPRNTGDIKLGDAWWEHSRKAPETEKRASEARARYWYGSALAGATGLDKVRVEERLGFKVAAIDYRPGLLMLFSSKNSSILKGTRGRISPIVDYSGREFFDGKTFSEVTVHWNGVLVAPRPGRYRFVAKTDRKLRLRVNGKTVLDTFNQRDRANPETTVILPDRATRFEIELVAFNVPEAELKLFWVAPGKDKEELIPREVFFHDRKTESVLNK